MAEVIRYPTEYKVLTPRPYISQRAASPPTIEVSNLNLEIFKLLKFIIISINI